jgi:hypothetical protein
MRLRPLLLATTMAAAFVAAASPASADTLSVEATVSPGEVQPGDTFTVTETVHNLTFGSILQPTIRLFSKETPLVSYADMVSCAGVGSSCTTVAATPDGPPAGYMAVMPRAMNGLESVTIVFTLRVKQDAQGAVHTLQGQLLGSNDGIFPQDVATLTVITQADAAVSLTTTPRIGLLASRIDVNVRVTNNGPGRLRSAQVTGTLTQGLTGNAGTNCTGGTHPVCTFGELAPGASATSTFSVPIGLLYIGLPYRIAVASTASSPTDPNGANNSAATTCTVITPLLVNCG